MIKLCSGNQRERLNVGTSKREQVDVRKWLWHPWVTRLIGLIFEHMSFVIPIKRLCETRTLLAFHHPTPAHPFHVLLVPKKAVVSLKELDPADTAFLTDLYSTVQNLVNEFQLPAYRLIVNGGEFQDFPQLHFHLISDVPRSNPSIHGTTPYQVGPHSGQAV